MNNSFREEIIRSLVESHDKNILLQAGTGVGKTKAALTWLRFQTSRRILIVVPRTVLITSWIKEMYKFKFQDIISRCDICCYASFVKQDFNDLGAIVFDEAHHITEKIMNEMKGIKTYTKLLFLSATFPSSKINDLNLIVGKIKELKVSTQKAIDNGVLPSPILYKIPLSLDNKEFRYSYLDGNRVQKKADIPYNKWILYKSVYYKKNQDYQVRVLCTEENYYSYLNGMVDKWSYNYSTAFHPAQKASFKKTLMVWSNKRLEFLAKIKLPIIKQITESLEEYRTLTFCRKIDHAIAITSNCISSLDPKQAKKTLQEFQDGKINHISAVNMLNEGVNLTDCQVGIFATVNSSEIMSIQKIGRILRHPEPIIILPYYKKTREEVLVNKILETYNSSLIKTTTLQKLLL